MASQTHIDCRTFSLQELQAVIHDAITTANRSADTIYVDALSGPDGVRFRLTERTLTDGSTVFDAVIGG